MNGPLHKKSDVMRVWNSRHFVYDGEKRCLIWKQTAGTKLNQGEGVVVKVFDVLDRPKRRQNRMDIRLASQKLVEVSAPSQSSKTAWLSAFGSELTGNDGTRAMDSVLVSNSLAGHPRQQSFMNRKGPTQQQQVPEGHQEECFPDDNDADDKPQEHLIDEIETKKCQEEIDEMHELRAESNGEGPTNVIAHPPHSGGSSSGGGGIHDACLRSGEGFENDQVLQATAHTPWLVIEEMPKKAGGDRLDVQLLLGRFQLIPGKQINGRGVWRAAEGNRGRHIFYVSSSNEWWLSDQEGDMEEGAASGQAKVGGGKKAPTPMHAPTAEWQVLAVEAEAGAGAGSASASVRSFVAVPELRARGPGQCEGDHLVLGISGEGFKMALDVVGWAGYARDERDFADGKGGCWNTGEHNGYDLGVLVRKYMARIGKSHLSFLEAVLEAEVAELAPLRPHVGAADAFYSHVQQVAPEVTAAGLAEASEQHANVLREDKEGTRRLRRAALVAFFQKYWSGGVEKVDFFLDDYRRDISGLNERIENGAVTGPVSQHAPDLASIRAEKPAGQPIRFFLDYLSLRQCISDFAVPRVLHAIATIGITVVEIGADWRSDEALLRRLFCVFESFGTVKAKGVLLVVGPALADRPKLEQLLQVATSAERCAEVMDSRTDARCRWAEEEKKIRGYIEDSVGYVKTDRRVLAAIAGACMDRVMQDMEAEGRRDEAATMLHGLAELLFEAEVRVYLCESQTSHERNECSRARACVCPFVISSFIGLNSHTMVSLSLSLSPSLCPSRTRAHSLSLSRTRTRTAHTTHHTLVRPRTCTRPHADAAHTHKHTHANANANANATGAHGGIGACHGGASTAAGGARRGGGSAGQPSAASGGVHGHGGGGHG
jgi:hypothetical protein